MPDPNEAPVVVITGASSGIGRAAAHAFAKRGASVVLAARRAGMLEEAARECEALGAASCALLPISAPVEIEGRLLGDGGLAANAPVDLVLDEPGPPGGDLLCFVVELFTLRGRRPETLAASVARATDLAFGGQTRRILEGRGREHRLRALVGRLADRLPPGLRDDPEVASVLAEVEADGARSATVLCVGYRASPDQARPGDAFDFSPATLNDRWEAGVRGMREALERFGTAPRPGARGLAVHEVEA